MRSLILLTALLLPNIAEAQELNTNDLTDEQKAQIALQIAQMKGKNNTPLPTIDELQEWTDWGKGMGTAIAATAKELGIAVDDFSKTGVGKITIAVIVYKVIGEDIIGIIWGSGLLTVFFPIWLIFTKRLLWIKEIEYHDNGKRKKIIPRKFDVDGDWGRLAASLVLLAVLLVTSGCFIL